MYNPIWTFRTKRFAVSLACAGNLYCDLSWDETGEAAAKIESGEWSSFSFRVSVALDGYEVGVVYLGDSIYADPAEFRDHIGAQGKYGSYFTDMVHEACREARQNVTALSPLPRLRAA